MILGTPVISSDVGGIKNLMSHQKEGFLYQADAPYMLAHYIKKIFEDKENAVKISVAARSKARITHDAEQNFIALTEIYQNITKEP